MNKDVWLSDEIKPLIWINPGRMSGVPRLCRTRVLVDALFGNLEDGLTLDEFLECFEGVTREQAVAVLELAHHSIQAPALD